MLILLFGFIISVYIYVLATKQEIICMRLT